ncbi:L-histidine N(alpha)-methyltransferase [Leptothrix discophora]|uniref:L-histidine N(Alpha)-methyltransferase n=1 Tax=Leptothrix discophora TaxID=89 RepID=A0ABT9FZL9_LEPDI|nr:L-histidine N(alpha)-methyltransferase [Leptothrix discophora]MDP4299677.1 L-histidine N(alpha)-methyltransferase [Leptothrix discophora]
MHAAAPPASSYADDLVAGLSASPRRLSPKWFYDEAGSALFDRICTLDAYYPTRVETALLADHADEIAAAMGPDAEIVEPGAGSARKVRVLLRAMQRGGWRPAGYLPVDISGTHLLAAADDLRADLHEVLPDLPVRPLAADFLRPLVLPAPLADGRRVGFYPGGSIGNFEHDEAIALLHRFADWIGPGGGLLIGVDRVKDPARLHAAYNDPDGVTAAFNLNLWARANREAGADFDLGAWHHAAFYDPLRQRIEMHLVSRRDQQVHVAGRTFDFIEGDSVHTENSCKYTVPGFQALAGRAGWQPQRVWSDPEGLFSLHWLTN